MRTVKGQSSTSLLARKYELTRKYRFEWGDFATLGYAVNIFLIVALGLSAAWFGLALGLVNLVHEIIVGKRISGLASVVLTIVLNLYFLLLYYGAV